MCIERRSREPLRFDDKNLGQVPRICCKVEQRDSSIGYQDGGEILLRFQRFRGCCASSFLSLSLSLFLSRPHVYSPYSLWYQKRRTTRASHAQDLQCSFQPSSSSISSFLVSFSSVVHNHS